MPTPPVAAVLGILAVTAASIVLFSNGLTLSPYKTLHFALSYETEFLKRGLVGEAIRRSGASPWHAAPGLFTLAVLLLLCGLYALAAHAILRQRADPTMAAILVALWASPAAMPHLAADFGRFDALLVLLLGSWALLSRALHATASLLLLALVGCAAMAVHEIAFLVTIPIGLVLWAIRYDAPVISLRTLPFGIVIAGVFALVWTFGGADILTREEVAVTISDRFGADDYSIALILLVLFGDISQNVVYSALQVGRLAPLREHLEYVVIMSGVFVLLGAIAVIIARSRPGYAWMAGLACLAPLALYPLGYDHFRWHSFVHINMTILFLWVMLHDPGTTKAVITRCRARQAGIVGLSLLFLGVGPLGVFTAFDLERAPLITLLRPSAETSDAFSGARDKPSAAFRQP
ncbi:hypothetical protein [Palleronia abyssalis]|uniref:Glycosyltransferase RgtA/B/C/D-like domain-containing protein n=1 Tax=Palleronia abyssalis TaxID=1501240 RepID=A0A2R8C0P1_9RHOB|nr:hypothetical protein [Palleronia abyssalis]SPJ25974.1 hypothetical protein PAA8504_03830 [Palleronia abyssalis]